MVKLVTFLRRRPLTSFFVVLFLLLLLIVAGNKLTKPAAEVAKGQVVKKVDVYTIGAIPKVKVQAQVQKDGVVTIMAQSSGIVQRVSVREGDKVTKGKNLVSLSTNYQGGNALSLQREIAARGYQNVADTFDAQKDLISKQRDIAGKSADNATQLRDITNKSLDESRSLISLNNDILSSLDSNINSLNASNVGGANDAIILQTKELKSQFASTNNLLNTGLRSAEFQASSDKPPAAIANLQKDIALKQMDIQEKSLDLNRDLGQLQLRLAQVSEALMFPAAPVSGIVQKVNVHAGQSVSPGTPLVTIFNAGGNVSAIARVPRSVASTISRIEASNIRIDEKTFSELPTFVSSEAVDGQLYSVIYAIPEEVQNEIANLAYVEVEIPIGQVDTSSVDPYVPLDAVFQTQDSAFVYVIDGEKAASKKVTLGEVLGQEVAVLSGLSDGDQIILSRNIVAGDSVSTNQ